MERIDAGLAFSISRWQRKHGCVLRRKLTREQRTQLKECYTLMVRPFAGAAGQEVPLRHNLCLLISILLSIAGQTMQALSES